MDIQIMSLMNAFFETILLVLCVRLILPTKTKFNYISIITYGVILMTLLILFSHNDIWNVIIFNFLLIILIKYIHKIETYVASLTVVILNLINTLASLTATCFGVYFFSEIIEYRVLLRDKALYYLFPKVAMILILTTIFKMYMKLIKKKVRTHRAKPKILFVLNSLYYILLLLISMNVIELLSKNYFNIKQIPKLDTYFFISIMFIYISITLLNYFMTLYIFNHTHYKIMKIYAETDPLTGIANRQAGFQFLQEKMQDSLRTGSNLTICFLDVNNLKLVNDKWGHNEGDRLISTVSEIVCSSLRANDNICRLGGDEFLVTFSNCDLVRAKSIWDRISKNFVAFNYQSGLRYDVTVSYGFAEYNGTQNISVEEFIEIADKRMYEYKTQFKKGFVTS